jgi:hypothetical protein
MKDRAPQMPFTYSPNIDMGIKSNALNQSVPGIMAQNKREHCAQKQLSDNPFAPVGLDKNGK